MEKVDVRGLSCPMPVLKTKKAIDAGAAKLLIIGTSQVSKENVSKLAKASGYNVNITVDQKDSWEMEIHKS